MLHNPMSWNNNNKILKRQNCSTLKWQHEIAWWTNTKRRESKKTTSSGTRDNFFYRQNRMVLNQQRIYVNITCWRFRSECVRSGRIGVGSGWLKVSHYTSKVWVRTEKTVVVLFSFMPCRAVLILLYLLMLHGMCKNKGSLLTMMGGCKHARDASNSKEFKYE